MNLSSLTRNTIVLSLDGVLVDTAPVVAHAMTQALRDHSGLNFSPSAVAGFIGTGLDQVFDQTAKAAGVTFDGDERDECLATFIEVYRQPSLRKISVQPLAVEGLKAFAERGMRVVVSTSLDEESAIRMMNDAGLLDFVTLVCGSTRGTAVRPYITCLYNAMTRVGAKAEDTVVVSASAVELLAARSHGIPGVGKTVNSRLSYFDGSTPVIQTLADLFDIPRATDDWSWQEKPLPMRETHQWLDRLLVAASSTGR